MEGNFIYFYILKHFSTAGKQLFYLQINKVGNIVRYGADFKGVAYEETGNIPSSIQKSIR